MRRSTSFAFAAAVLIAVGASPAAAQQSSLIADLLADVGQVEKKMLALAKAMPPEKFDWRPAEGVRSFAEVVRHVAADNYLIPATVGIPADPATGIKGDDYNTAATYEKRALDRDASIVEMEKSFAHLRRALEGTTEARLKEKVKLFGQEFSVQRTWILAATHLHEHLGQAIAYARSNDVVPPWSK